MDTHSTLVALSVFTLVAVLAIGGWQLASVRRSQARHGEAPGEANVAKRVQGDPT